MLRSGLMIFGVLAIQAYADPQFITYKDGKLGVNFGGYHAGVGLGGILGGGGNAGGGLFAEAGTPFGQAARAGLGGSVDGNSGATGGLYAGATAGGNVKAAAGLGGAVGADKAVGGGYATAQNGGHASPDLNYDSGITGSSLPLPAQKPISASTTIVKKIKVTAVPVDETKPVHKKVHNEVNHATNEINAVFKAGSQLYAADEVNTNDQPSVINNDVYAALTPPPHIEKTISRTHKPHRHHLSTTAYIGGNIGGGADVAALDQMFAKKIDLGGNEQANTSAGPHAKSHSQSKSDVTYSQRVSVGSNPTFFRDIFNIPISTLNAVNSFLTNAARGTKVSVEKSSSVEAGAETDQVSAKHVHPSSSSSSEAHISVQTPSASKLIDDIFAIPINTLSAVNKFLENNAARKRVQVTAEESGEPTRIRLGPHARRRANKQVIIVKESTSSALPQDSH